MFCKMEKRMYRKSEEVNLTRREITWWAEAFTLHDHNCGHVYQTKIWGQYRISGIANKLAGRAISGITVC